MANSLSDPATAGNVLLLSPLVPQSGSAALSDTVEGSGFLAPISGIHLPQTQGSVSLGNGIGRGMHHLGNGIVACASQTGKFYLVDVSNPAAPAVVNTGGTATMSGAQVTTSWGRYLAVAGTPAGDTGRLSIYDVSSPHSPVAVASNLAIGAVGSTMNYLRVFGPHLFIVDFGGSGIGAVYLYDISDPTNPVLASTISRTFVTDVALVGNGRYLAINAGNTLYMFDIANRLNPTQVYSGTPSGMGGNTQGIAAFEHYLAVTSQGAGAVHLLDVANVTAPVVIASVTIGGALQVEPMGRLLAVTDPTDQTVSLVSAQTVSSPVILAGINLGLSLSGIVLVGRSLVIGASNGTITCVSLGTTDIAAARIATLDAARIRADSRIEGRAIIATERLAVGEGGGTIGGSLSVGQDLRGRHVGSSGPALPSGNFAAQSAAGTSASATGSAGDDHSGQLTLQSGSAAWGAGAQLVLTFAQPYLAAPTVLLTPANANAAAAMKDRQVYVSATTTTLALNFGLADTAATTYVWNYVVDGH